MKIVFLVSELKSSEPKTLRTVSTIWPPKIILLFPDSNKGISNNAVLRYVVLNAAGKDTVRIFWLSVQIIQNISSTATYIVKLACMWGSHGQEMGQGATEDGVSGGHMHIYWYNFLHNF
jgi:hypothetical protein